MSDVVPQSNKRQRRATISTPRGSQSYDKESLADPPASSASISKSAGVSSSRADRDKNFQRILEQFLDAPTSGSEDDSLQSPAPSKPALARKRAHHVEQTPPPSPQPTIKAKRALSDVQLANLAAGRAKAIQSRRQQKKTQRDQEAEEIATRAVASALAKQQAQLAEQQQQQPKQRAPKRKKTDADVSTIPTKPGRVQGKQARAKPSVGKQSMEVARRLQFEEESIHPHLHHAAF